MLLSIAAAGVDTVDLMVGVKKSMRTTLITPDGVGPHPAVLVLHASGGLERADIDFAEALTKAGYVALAPAFLQPYGITTRTRRETFTTEAGTGLWRYDMLPRGTNGLDIFARGPVRPSHCFLNLFGKAGV